MQLCTGFTIEGKFKLEKSPNRSPLVLQATHFTSSFFFFLNLINLNKEFACNKKQISRTVDSFQWFSYSEV